MRTSTTTTTTTAAATTKFLCARCALAAALLSIAGGCAVGELARDASSAVVPDAPDASASADAALLDRAPQPRDAADDDAPTPRPDATPSALDAAPPDAASVADAVIPADRPLPSPDAASAPDDAPACSSMVTCYRDADGDGYGATAMSARECACAAGWVLRPGDCDDANASAFPGQARFFTRARSGGSFDYNCDGATEPEVPAAAPCVGLPASVCAGAGGWTTSVPRCGDTQLYARCTLTSLLCTVNSAFSAPRTQACR